MCPDKSILSAWFDCEVDLQWSGEIAEHLETCVQCGSYIEGLKKQKAVLHSLPTPEFEDSLVKIKERIRERHTVSGTTRFWQKKIPLPLAAAAAILVASVTLGTNLLATARSGRTFLADSASENFSGNLDLPGNKIDELFSMMESTLSDEFSSNSIVELPADFSLIFNGESQLVRTAGFNGSASP